MCERLEETAPIRGPLGYPSIACSAHLAQLSLTNVLPNPYSAGENGVGLRGLDAATVLQPEPDTPGQCRKTTAQETAKTAYICQISRQDSTHPESFDLTYKEGVAGSTPASPTVESSQHDQALFRVTPMS